MRASGRFDPAPLSPSGPASVRTTDVSPRLLPPLLALAALPAPALAQSAPWPTDAWPTSTPEARGLDPAPLYELDRAIRAGTYGNVDRLVVVADGFLVASERYARDYREISRGFTGPLGCGYESCEGTRPPPEYNYYDPATHPWREGRDVHTLQSVTKSVVATVVGVAIERGDIAGVDAPFLPFLEERHDLSEVDPRLRRATLEDLLTMRSGIEWHEVDRPLDETNTTLQLERSDDWIGFTLAQSMDAEPGAKWAYNSGGSHLVSGVVRGATGRFIDDYAEEYLFGPLGIDEYHWKRTPAGYPDTEGGLYLDAEDLARIGLLYLRDGVWAGERILPAGWAERATAAIVEDVNDPGWDYGYQWWRLDRDGVRVWAGLGFGGQLLFVLPDHDVVGVVNAWNLFEPPERSALEAFREALVRAVGVTTLEREVSTTEGSDA